MQRHLLVLRLFGDTYVAGTDVLGSCQRQLQRILRFLPTLETTKKPPSAVNEACRGNVRDRVAATLRHAEAEALATRECASPPHVSKLARTPTHVRSSERAKGVALRTAPGVPTVARA
jgi:hypothetical protein